MCHFHECKSYGQAQYLISSLPRIYCFLFVTLQIIAVFTDFLQKQLPLTKDMEHVFDPIQMHVGEMPIHYQSSFFFQRWCVLNYY